MEKFHLIAQSLEELIDATVLSAGQGFQVLLGSDFKQAFDILPAQFPLLDEATESLGLHEDLQEASQAFRGDSFSEGFSLQAPLLA